MSHSIFTGHLNGVIVIDSLHLYFVQNYAFEITNVKHADAVHLHCCVIQLYQHIIYVFYWVS